MLYLSNVVLDELCIHVVLFHRISNANVRRNIVFCILYLTKSISGENRTYFEEVIYSKEYVLEWPHIMTVVLPFSGN